MGDRVTSLPPGTPAVDPEERLQFLYTASRELLEADRPRQLIGKLFAEFSDLLGLDVYVNYLVQSTPGGPRLRLDSCGGIPVAAVPSLRWLDFGAGVCGAVAQRRERIVVTDVLDRTDEMTTLVRQLGLRMYACHPLMVSGRLYGTLSFGSRREERFDDDALSLLASLSDLCAIALQRADLQEQEARARRELEMRELHLRALSGFQSECVKVMDAAGTILEVNQAGLEMLSSTRAQVEGRGVLDFVVEADKSRVRNALRAASDGIETSIGYAIETSTGRRVDVHSTMLPLTAASGGARRVLAVTLDLARQRHARQAFADLDSQFRALVEHLSEVVLVVASDQTIRYASPSIEDLTGYGPGEVSGRRISSYVHPDDGKIVAATLSRRLAGDESPGYSELRIAHKNGRWKLVEARATLFRMVPPELIITARDVTLARSREIHYKALFESINAGFCIGEVQFDDTGRCMDYRFLEVNPAFLELTGSADPTGKGARELLPDEDDYWYDMYGRVARTGIPEQTTRFVETLGKWLDVRAFQVGSPERNHIAILFDDITDRRRLEERVRQGQKLEAVGRFAAGVAHDFNNILTVIQGHAGLISEDLPAGSPACRDATEIRNAADRAADLTRQLMAFGRKRAIDERNLDLGEVVTEMRAWLKRITPERIELRQDTEARGIVVRVDRSQLHQVILNLVANAVDAIDGTGRITLRVDRVEGPQADATGPSGSVPPGRYARIAIEDTGHGIPEKVLPDIFEPFFTTKLEGKGTGLGLATVIGIIRQAGGHVLVQSSVGAGTTFSVLLPLQHAAAEPLSQRTHARHGRGEGTVLLVEDDDDVRQVEARVLRNAGYEVVEAGNGSDALAILQRGDSSFRVVISDVVMPEVGGLELLRQYARREPMGKFILTSGYSGVEADIGDLGATFLQKPYTPQELLEAIAEVLGE